MLDFSSYATVWTEMIVKKHDQHFTEGIHVMKKHAYIMTMCDTLTSMRSKADWKLYLKRQNTTKLPLSVLQFEIYKILW